MKHFTSAIVITVGALLAAPAAFAQMPGDAQQQRLNDMRDKKDQEGTEPRAGRPGLPPSPTLNEQVQQRNNDQIELQRTTGQPGNSPAPRGMAPNPTPTEQMQQRTNDQKDQKDQEGMARCNRGKFPGASIRLQVGA